MTTWFVSDLAARRLGLATRRLGRVARRLVTAAGRNHRQLAIDL